MIRELVLKRPWSALLALLLFAYFLDTIINAGAAVEIASRALYMVVFLGTALAADLPVVARRVAVSVVLVWPLSTVLNKMVGWTAVSGAELAILSLILMGSLLIVFREVARSGDGRRDVTAAAIFGFMLMTLAFALIYVKLEDFEPGSFDLGSAESHVSSLIYFSLVTITTLGFGDIIPVSRLARILVGMEAAMGLMYVAVFISRAASRR